MPIIIVIFQTPIYVSVCLNNVKILLILLLLYVLQHIQIGVLKTEI